MSSKKGPGKKIFLAVCLALVCVASAELLVCRFAAPDLFQRITAPVIAAAEHVRLTAVITHDSPAGAPRRQGNFRWYGSPFPIRALSDGHSRTFFRPVSC